MGSLPDQVDSNICALIFPFGPRDPPQNVPSIMSAPGDFGPSPPGVDLSENQKSQMLGAVIALMVVGPLAVLLRVYTRLKTSQAQFGLDDCFISAALFSAYGSGICVIISTRYKNGWHQQALTHDDFTVVWKLLFAQVIIYASTVTCTKTSIVLFYRRIFNLRYSLYAAMFFILGYFVAVVITIAAACRPFPFCWEHYINPQASGTCIDVSEFLFASGIASVLIDALILCVPAPIIWKLQMPKSQRLAVTGILLLGSFVCVAGIVRVVMLARNLHSSDPSWTIAPVFVWSCVEPFIGIVCACLPTVSPLFRRWWEALAPRKYRPHTEEYGPGGGISGMRYLERGMSRRERRGILHGDEVGLTTFPTWPVRLLHIQESRESMADLNARIRVEEEVTVSWT
ncbi:hypothetical protein NUU61_010125 [Penicillium alfredii]|uniref:Rhodopsin domain-containing protein n=1 Tax=Penicillium alfredii TaxID=1506179 RepID=A0A9W9EHE8_9EURO|nr:uncharacterized protein NUU61_010125 [Penicillium alfredii]KAJ5081861.1 hypothetical protein NUU61_010125 [Penicillium alfredii]